MPDIVYDGKKLSVPAGTNLVDAGAAAGVSVPIFCYHKDLGAIGSCRVCAVTVTQAGKSKTVMGCMTEAQDGMEITTLDEHSRQLRKLVLEWIMVNHPHDCPICDEGGECQLQDLTIAAEHGIRRTELKKRTFQNQYLGEFIQHEMNRCITCYRCQRFYQDYAGGRDFGVTGSQQRVYFGRFEDGPFDSPFSGNLVELCPTGVFTDKLFRYKSRVWDLEIAPSICPHCPVGCNVLPGSRHRMLQRVRMRENPDVNGAFICDRGQFGHGYVMDPARPRTIRVQGGEAADWDGALALTGGALLETARQHGAASVALVTSPRASLETHFALRQLAGGPLDGARIAHFDDPDRETRSLASLAAVQSAGVDSLEQSDLAGCDVLVIAGTSLVDEAPLAALAARQCARAGGQVFVLSPLERYLGDVATVFLTHPAKLAETLDALAPGRGGAPGSAAAALEAAQRPGLLIGHDLVDGAALAAASRLARSLKSAGKAVRFGTLFSGPNGFGAAAMSTGPALQGILADLEAGALHAAVLVECDIAAWSPRARQALEKLPLLVVLDHLPGPLADKARTFLPTTATYESNGTYVNRAGRLQGFAADRAPGRSAIEEIQNNSFRRTYRREAPESDARMAWWILAGLREHTAGKPGPRELEAVRDAICRSHEAWKPLRGVRAGDRGVSVDRLALTPATAEVPAFGHEPGLQLFRFDRTLGSETLSRRSEAMRKMAGPPTALVATADAQRLGMNGRIVLEAEGSAVEMAAEAHLGVAPGVVLVPRDVDWPIIPRQGGTVRAMLPAQEVAR